MENKIILFADNQTSFLEVRKEFLEKVGYKVITADNPDKAKKILEQGTVDLAILDIRLVDDNDPSDNSGLILAKNVARSIPKIILTAFPTWEGVREALGPDLDGIPPAVDFIYKEEGPEAMMRAVDWTFNRQLLRENLINVFEASTLMELPMRVQNLGPDEASRRFQESFDLTSEKLMQYREQENQHASRYHFWALAMAIIGMVLVTLGVLLAFTNRLTSTTLPLIAGVISQIVSTLFFTREDTAHKRVSTYFTKLEEINKLGNLLTICDSLPDPFSRKKYKEKLINKVIEKWFGK